MSNKRSRKELLEDIVQSVAANLYDNWTDGHLEQSQSDWEKQALVHLRCQRPQHLEHSPDGWCVTIVIASPDWKRPSSSTTTQHFRTEEQANAFVRQSKIDYLLDYGFIDQEDAEEITDEKISDWIDDKVYDRVYGDSYMDMSPYDASVKKIKFESE